MKNIFVLSALGFSCGLPYMLVFSTLSAWLRDAGAALTVIGFISWAALTYSLKFLWSPFVDRNKNASKPSCWSKTILDSHDATADLDFNHDDESI